ncbi:MAG: hypothetical protein KTR20_13960 [Cellvibrionaceae bacterium]|nr:hypothetical protein [Cellvibrionaceae bacterium]
MTYAEFQAILEGYVPLEDVASKVVQVVYLRINSSLHITAAVFFCLPFDKQGFIENAWDIPLEQLADNTAEGPDMGSGAISLACFSQCPAQCHQKNLWEPDASHFDGLEKSLKNNDLGLTFAQKQVSSEHRQVTVMDGNDTEDQYLKYKLSAIKVEQDMRQLSLDYKERLLGHQQQLHDYQQQVLQQKSEIQALQSTISCQQAKELELAEMKKALSASKVETLYRAERESKLQEEVLYLQRQNQRLRESVSGSELLDRLLDNGVNLVTYHPGAGHVSIPPDEASEYLDNPMGYIARQCGVNEHLYRVWLDHYYSPTCQHSLDDGECCDAPLERVEDPSQFIVGESDRCRQHQTQCTSIVNINKNGRPNQLCSVNNSSN